VCWRLAKQLANEHGLAVRLWVDDMESFRRLCPEIDPAMPVQDCRGVGVRRWTEPFPQTEPAQMVIEAFACRLPESYVAAMAEQARKPVWIALEHLSAEGWVAGCHKLPSPHPQLPLVKHFFFPGFTPQAGGLLLERGLLARRDAFQRDPQALARFWQALGMLLPRPDEVRVSLFCYENPALPGLLGAWADGGTPVCCLVPEGRPLPQVAAFFGQGSILPENALKRGNLEVRVLPFMEQERYDELLWACDINFVRGEDSCVRAQWAARPLVWHIYPQHDGVHMQKLRAFLELYCAGLSPDVAEALQGFWECWNGAPCGPGQAGVREAWNEFLAHRSMLRQHASIWARQLSGNNLAINLLDFFREIGKIRAS
jgi:uncharacterized repeat protein (TIGR03837 family)